MNYKGLCNTDKIAAITQCNFFRSELGIAEQYIEALKTDDGAIIGEFESFGSNPSQIVQNKAYFARALSVFGFTGITFNEHGWPESEAFLDCETFAFGCATKGNMGSNNLTIGRGPNGKWTYGIRLSTPKSGYCFGLSVFNPPHGSRRECLRHGLEEVIAWHTKENDKRTTLIIREAKEMLDEITGRKPKQLSLFSFGGVV